MSSFVRGKSYQYAFIGKIASVDILSPADTLCLAMTQGLFAFWLSNYSIFNLTVAVKLEIFGL